MFTKPRHWFISSAKLIQTHPIYMQVVKENTVTCDISGRVYFGLQLYVYFVCTCLREISLSLGYWVSLHNFTAQ